MTDRAASSRDLLFLAAALLVAAAIALVFGVVPPVSSDVFAQAAPRSAAAATQIHALVAFLLAIVLGVMAASRLARSLPGPAVPDVNAWKTRIAPAAVLGLGSFFWMFLLGEGLKIPANVPAPEYVGALVVAMVLGGYSLLATYMLLRGLPRPGRNVWIVLALNAALLLAALLALLVEPNKSAALQVLGVAIVSSAGSYGGLALAGRASGRRVGRLAA